MYTFLFDIDLYYCPRILSLNDHVNVGVYLIISKPSANPP